MAITEALVSARGKRKREDLHVCLVHQKPAKIQMYENMSGITQVANIGACTKSVDVLKSVQHLLKHFEGKSKTTTLWL